MLPPCDIRQQIFGYHVYRWIDHVPWIKEYFSMTKRGLRDDCRCLLMIRRAWQYDNVDSFLSFLIFSQTVVIVYPQIGSHCWNPCVWAGLLHRMRNDHAHSYILVDANEARVSCICQVSKDEWMCISSVQVVFILGWYVIPATFIWPMTCMICFIAYLHVWYL